MRTWILCLGVLAASSFASTSFAGHGPDCGCGHGHAPLFGHWGVRHCANCDDSPVVVGGPGIPCGGNCGSCSSGCGGGHQKCGSNCHRGGMVCRLFGWIGQCGKCSGCGPKYIPEWHSRPCEPCNRCGDWTGPSIHHGKPYLGPPRSGSNIGGVISVEPTAAPQTVPQPKATILPETSVRRVRRTSYGAPSAPKQMPRHRRAVPTSQTHAAPRTVRVVRIPASQSQSNAKPFRGIVIE